MKTKFIPVLFCFFVLIFTLIFGCADKCLSVFAAAFVHECGHAFAAVIVHAPLRTAKINGLGLCLDYDFSLVSPFSELFVCLAGPLAGILSAAVCFTLGITSAFADASLLLALFNLIPISFLDGGAALHAALSFFLLPDTAYKISNTISLIFLTALWCTSVVTLITSGFGLAYFFVIIYLLFRIN